MAPQHSSHLGNRGPACPAALLSPSLPPHPTPSNQWKMGTTEAPTAPLAGGLNLGSHGEGNKRETGASWAGPDLWTVSQVPDRLWCTLPSRL